MNFSWRKYALGPLMCLVLLGTVSCGELLNNLTVVPLKGVREFLNLDQSFFNTQSDAGGMNEEGDQFAAAVFPGDLNGDGFTDLIAGAPEKGNGEGVVFIYFGSEAGATIGGFSITQADAGEVGEAGDRFGAALVTGDFNGDRIDDLAVGAPGKAPAGGVKSGAVFIFIGKADGTFEPGFMLTQTDAGEVNEAGDQYGAVLATSDFDGDLFSELIVGAPAKALGGGPRSGAVFIFFGSAGGLVPGPTPVLTQTDAGGANEEGDRFGASLETAHFNGSGGVDFGDGFSDLAVGAPGKNGNSGAVFVFLGSGSGFAQGFVLTQADARGAAGCVPAVPGGCVPGVNEPGDRFGEALGVGDLNGDGVEELAVGAPGEDGNSGAVYIFPGSPTLARGLTTGYYITQGNARQVNEAGDQFGADITAGVVNEDEMEELVVGAPGEDGGSGAIFLFPGTRQETGTVTGFMVTQADAGGVNNPGDRFGSVLTIEDFNDNAGADVAVGAPGDAPGGGPRSGAVFIFPGVPTSPPAFTAEDACRTVAGVIRPQGPPGGPLAQPCTVSNEAGAKFGSASATGDFNSDGFVDLVLGAPGKGGGSGAVFVFPGSVKASGISTGFFITQADAGAANEAGDQFGAAVATGDFNNDGFMDLAVGAPGEDGGSGAVYIFPGTVNGLTCIEGIACPTTTITGSVVTQANAGGVNEAGDRFGAALAVGDFNSDGIEDLAVGAPGDGIGGVKAGSVFVFPGAPTGLILPGQPPPPGITTGFMLTQTDAVAGEVNEDGDLFGASLAAGNVTGDVFQELIVGAPGEAPGAAPKAGSVFVFRGSLGGLTAGFLVTQTDAGEANEAGDEFGAALVLGDFNGDFMLDLAVGAPGDAPAAISPTKAGSVFVFQAPLDGLSPGPINVVTHVDLTDAEDIADTSPLADGDRFGAALAIGRFNDDIFDELIVGAPGKAPIVATDPKGGTITVFPGSDGSAVADGITLDEGITLGIFLIQKGSGGEIEDGDLFGAAMAVGDFNGDTLDDLIVGAPGDALGAEPAESGVANLLPAGEVRFKIR